MLHNNRRFNFVRYELPDHKCNKLVSKDQILDVLKIIDDFYCANGSVLVHCFAGIERSPLICISWMMKRENLNYINAYEYVKSVHRDTNPLQEQLNVIKQL